MADMTAHPQAGERAERTRNVPVLVPAADIYETEDALFLSLEMPGVSPDAVNIMLDQRVLTISGCSRVSVPEGYSLTHHEYREGDCERAFTLSLAIDSDKIEAAEGGSASLEVTEIAARASEDDQRKDGGMRPSSFAQAPRSDLPGMRHLL